MSNTTTFALGLGSGIALWHLTRPASVSPALKSTPLRNGIVHVNANGLVLDGEALGVDEVVVQCRAAGRAAVVPSPDASAALYAELLRALREANVPVLRNAAGGSIARRDENAPSSTFTLAIYVEGVGKGRRDVRWFSAAIPTSWEDARDRLAAAGLLDPRVVSPHAPGYWKLTTEPVVFKADRATPLPPLAERKPRGSRRSAKRYAREGRRILRDGQPLVAVERIGSDREGYSVSPYEADQIAERIVRLLNRQSERGVGREP